jgi:type II secretory pathway pseudopilin PulG
MYIIKTKLVVKQQTNLPATSRLRRTSAFTLFELLLVMIVLSALMLGLLRYRVSLFKQQSFNSSALQIQQILNASLSYYTSFGAWPVTCGITVDSNGNVNSAAASSNSTLSSSQLITSGYLPGSFGKNVYGYSYKIGCGSTTGVFYVISQTLSNTTATIISGMVPVAYVSNQYGVPDSSAGVYVTAQITIPGTILNNARSINFASLYAHNSCVPVPSCLSGMTAQIIVIPAAVVGVGNYDPTYLNYNAYPLTAFNAYATGPNSANALPECDSTAITACPNTPVAESYWRVCLKVYTQNGALTGTDASGNSVTKLQKVFALTRCAPPSEPV